MKTVELIWRWFRARSNLRRVHLALSLRVTVAAILALLGMNHEKLTYKYAGRDFRLTDVEGHVVKEIFA